MVQRGAAVLVFKTSHLVLRSENEEGKCGLATTETKGD